jgi:hypothetical protein
MITALRLPIRWSDLGFPPYFAAGAVVLADGSPAWAWQGTPPALGIDTFPAPEGAPAASRWDVDHLVLLVPDVDLAVLEVEEAGVALRRRDTVRGQPTAFFFAGTTLEVIETGVPEPRLYGVALATERPLEEIADAWRATGLTVAGPRDAIQTGRQIMVVKGLDAGLAVMALAG